MDERKSLRCSIIRGGTSKGIFIKENELPDDPAARDAVIRAVFGSPDIRQIDGLGGADVLTSKLAIIGPPSRPDADVDYTEIIRCIFARPKGSKTGRSRSGRSETNPDPGETPCLRNLRI